MSGESFDAAREIDRCSLCATCTYVCPVFTRTHQEGHTARGHMQLVDAFLLRPDRINADGTVTAAASGGVAISPAFEKMLDCCLRCYRCMDVCPSGIHTVSVFEQGRAELSKRRVVPDPVDKFTSFVLMSRFRIHETARLGAVVQFLISLFWNPKPVKRDKERLQTNIHESEISRHSSKARKSDIGANNAIERFKSPVDDAFWFLGKIAVPRVAARFFLGSAFARARAPKSRPVMTMATPAGTISGSSIDEIHERAVTGKRRLRIAYLVDCMNDVLYPSVPYSTVRVLERAGCEIVIPNDACCCGAPALGTGDISAFERMAKQTHDKLMSLDCDYIIVSNPTCAKTMRYVYPERFGAGFAEFASKVRMDFEVFNLVRNALPVEKLDELVGWHDPCHQRYAYKIYQEPRDLLAACANYTERRGESECCGFGGTFCMDFAAMAQRMACDKGAYLADAPETEIATTCPACLYYLNQHSAATGAKHHAVHLSEIVDRATE